MNKRNSFQKTIDRGSHKSILELSHSNFELHARNGNFFSGFVQSSMNIFFRPSLFHPISKYKYHLRAIRLPPQL